MKRLCLLYVVLLLWVVPITVSAGNELPWEKKLPFKSATIQYTIIGIEEGTETLYIRDYGNERATYHQAVSKMMGMTVKNSSVEFKTPDYIYSYDLQSREGFKGSNPQKFMAEEYNKLSGAEKKKVRENGAKMGMAFTEGMGGELHENAIDILGHSCDEMEIMGGTSVYLLHGTDIPLKTEMNMMGMKMTMLATSVDIGKVDDKYFQHPSGITPEIDTQTDTMAREMARQVIVMLQDPGNAPQMQMPSMGAPGPMGEMSEADKQMMQQAEEAMKGLKQMFGK